MRWISTELNFGIRFCSEHITKRWSDVLSVSDVEYLADTPRSVEFRDRHILCKTPFRRKDCWCPSLQLPAFCFLRKDALAFQSLSLLRRENKQSEDEDVRTASFFDQFPIFYGTLPVHFFCEIVIMSRDNCRHVMEFHDLQHIIKHGLCCFRIEIARGLVCQK